jgi:hypothetical protein
MFDHVHHLLLGTMILADDTLAKAVLPRRRTGRIQRGVAPTGPGR